jgi:hypothetical protein
MHIQFYRIPNLKEEDIKIKKIEIIIKGTEEDFKDLQSVIENGLTNTPQVIGLNQTKIVNEIKEIIKKLNKYLKHETD